MPRRDSLMQVVIPRAVQLVLDDVGWREGWRLDDSGGPFRAGVDRLLEPADYDAIADLGQRLAVRPSAATILCEWDRTNICADHPTSTQFGAAWDNRHRVGEWSDFAASIFRSRAANLELALHGVGHEHWDDGVRTRAEWHGVGGERWDFDALRGHLDCYQAILDQHGLGPAGGSAFPRHMVPCAFLYYLDPSDPQDTGALLSAAGVELVSTPFGGGFHGHGPRLASDGALDHDCLVLDRGSNGVPWFAYDTVPALVMGQEEATETDEEILAEVRRGALDLPAEEIELLFLRRPAARPADHETLVAAHFSVLLSVAQFCRGRGVGLRELLVTGRQALELAVRSYPADAPTAFDRYAEELIRQALDRQLATADNGKFPPLAGPTTSFCGIHWPNILRPDPTDNDAAVNRWVGYLRQVAAQPGLMLAANVQECFAQWVYHTFGRVSPTPDGFTLDLTGAPAELAPFAAAYPAVVEVPGHARVGVLTTAEVRAVWYRRDGGSAYLALAGGWGRRVDVTMDSRRPLSPVVQRDGTFNPLDLAATADGQGLALSLELFGQQRVPIALDWPPASVEVSGLTLHGQRYNAMTRTLTLDLSAQDIQGQRGTVTLRRPPA